MFEKLSDRSDRTRSAIGAGGSGGGGERGGGGGGKAELLDRETLDGGEVGNFVSS